MVTLHDRNRIMLGLKCLLTKDRYLLANNLGERTLTHKLAEHYQSLFNEWDVDSEYNRNLGDPKDVEFKPEEILELMADKLENNGYLLDFEPRNVDDRENIKAQLRDLERQLRDHNRLEYVEELDIVWFTLTLENNEDIKKAIYPDIIIHKRGTSDNHIVIEAKRSLNTSRKARAYDLIKLITMVTTPELKYRCGYFIDLPVGKHFHSFKGFSKAIQFSPNVFKIIPRY